MARQSDATQTCLTAVTMTTNRSGMMLVHGLTGPSMMTCSTHTNTPRVSFAAWAAGRHAWYDTTQIVASMCVLTRQCTTVPIAVSVLWHSLTHYWHSILQKCRCMQFWAWLCDTDQCRMTSQSHQETRLGLLGGATYLRACQALLYLQGNNTGNTVQIKAPRFALLWCKVTATHRYECYT